MSTSNYKLTIGNNSYMLNTATSITNFGSVTLTKLSFDKGIYRPGKIEATLSVPSSATYSTIKDLFFEENISNNRRFVSLKYNEGTQENTIASNYYVYKCKPIFSKISGNSTMSVELTIHSEDMLMTLDKYSEAFTAKKLGKDIFSERVKNFKFIEKTFKKDTDGKIVLENGVPTLDSVTIERLISTNANSVSKDLKVISYSDTTSNSENEFIQPYLVQYNESFYDFLKRTANRCGEFLYHENGKLNLGMQVTDKTADTYTFADDASNYYFEDTAEDGLGYDSFGYSYMNPKETSACIYNDPLATDEYLDKIDKKYTSFTSELIDIRRNLPGYVFDALKATSIGEAIANFGMTIAGNLFSAIINNKTKNYNNDKTNIKDWENDKEHWNQDQLRQFGTGVDQLTSVSSTVTNLYASFYDIIRQRQEEVGRTTLILNFETNLQDLKIGDMIKVDSKHYLVIGVNGSLEYADQKFNVKQEVKAIPFYETNNNTITYTPIPPKQTDVYIRESESQHAVVYENLDPQKLGRVRVRFVWQQSGDPTPWIRIAIPFASDGGAIKFVPEKGDEVMVNFIDGNVEHPYVVGSLLSPKSNDSWGELPDRTITSKNGHSITFDDDPGGAQFFTNMMPLVGAIRSFFPSDLIPWNFDFQETRSLVGGTTISDRYGFYKIEMNSATRSININSPLGDISLNAFTGISINAPNGDISINGKNVNISASNKVNITSGSNIKNRFFADSGLDLSNHSKKELFAQSAGRTAFQALYDGSKTFYDALISKFIDLTLFRTFLEIFTRPIDGTTSIKSFTFVQIEAGKGAVEYPAEAFSSKHTDKANFLLLQHSIDALNTTINSRVDAIKNAYESISTSLNTFNALSGSCNDLENKDEGVIKYDAIKKKGFTDKTSAFEDKDFSWNATGLDIVPFDRAAAEKNLSKEPVKNDYKNENEYKVAHTKWETEKKQKVDDPEEKAETANKEKEKKQQKVKDAAKGLAESFITLANTFADFTDKTLSAKGVIFTDKCVETLNTIKTELTGDDKLFIKKISTGDIEKDTDFSVDLKWDDLKTTWKRKAIFKLIEFVKDDVSANTKELFTIDATYNKASEVTNDTEWKQLVSSWVKEAAATPDPTGILDYASNLWESVKEWPKETFTDSWKDATVNRRRWGTGMKGKILMSDTPDKTISFDSTGASNATQNLTVSDKYAIELVNKLKNIK